MAAPKDQTEYEALMQAKWHKIVKDNHDREECEAEVRGKWHRVVHHLFDCEACSKAQDGSTSDLEKLISALTPDSVGTSSTYERRELIRQCANSCDKLDRLLKALMQTDIRVRHLGQGIIDSTRFQDEEIPMLRAQLKSQDEEISELRAKVKGQDITIAAFVNQAIAHKSSDVSMHMQKKEEYDTPVETETTDTQTMHDLKQKISYLQEEMASMRMQHTVLHEQLLRNVSGSDALKDNVETKQEE